jgi:glycosyltransferase involved in cell wall biosynthesis
MNILAFTNTFSPHVGGVAHSVEGFATVYRRLGHRVLVVTTRFPGVARREADVVRFPAFQSFRGSDFSVPLPVPGRIAGRVARFAPDIVHSHHPFLLGDTALRVAAARGLPIVYTHHTMYEHYTHYVPGDSRRLRRFAIELYTGYANLCDAVIAPSDSVAEILARRGVETRTVVIPTGVDRARFRGGDRKAGRLRASIPPGAFVVGHVGRLTPEKNLDFLARALASFAGAARDVVVLVVGDGLSRDDVRGIFEWYDVADRLRTVGALDGQELADAYAAMDVFAFASQSETQGIVLVEAMAAGVPVVAVDAPGVREVVRDGRNGRLLPREDQRSLVAALDWVRGRSAAEHEALAAGLVETAERFSIDETARQALALYEECRRRPRRASPIDSSAWARARRRLAEEWKIARNVATAAGDAWLGWASGNLGR